MKTLSLLLVLLLTPLISHAFIPVDVDYTGNVAEKFDFGGYIPGSTGGYMGGPMANNSRGGAFQFIVMTQTQFDCIILDALAFNQGYADIEESEFSFKLYKDDGVSRYRNPVPNTANLIAMSPVYLTSEHRADKAYTDHVISFQANLEPGTYWFAREREYGDKAMMVTSIEARFAANDVGESMANIHAPEPSTLALLGGGLWAMLRRRKTP